MRCFFPEIPATLGFTRSFWPILLTRCHLLELQLWHADRPRKDRLGAIESIHDLYGKWNMDESRSKWGTLDICLVFPTETSQQEIQTCIFMENTKYLWVPGSCIFARTQITAYWWLAKEQPHVLNPGWFKRTHFRKVLGCVVWFCTLHQFAKTSKNSYKVKPPQLQVGLSPESPHETLHAYMYITYIYLYIYI